MSIVEQLAWTGVALGILSFSLSGAFAISMRRSHHGLIRSGRNGLGKLASQWHVQMAQILASINFLLLFISVLIVLGAPVQDTPRGIARLTVLNVITAMLAYLSVRAAAFHERFDRYVSHLKDSFGEIGDQRLTVMAGIMVMDELSELQKRIAGMESEVVTLRKTRDEALTKADKNDSVLTGALGALAQRMEDLATALVVPKA